MDSKQFRSKIQKLSVKNRHRLQIVYQLGGVDISQGVLILRQLKIVLLTFRWDFDVKMR